MNSISDLISQKAGNFLLPDPTQEFDFCPSIPLTAPTQTESTEIISSIISDPTVDAQKLGANQTIKTMVYALKDQLDAILRLLDGENVSIQPKTAFPVVQNNDERVLEGIFIGDKMKGDDGKEYNMPPNYASKSKLVEGDRMKLTITRNGSFIYKQIKQVERRRQTGELVFDAALDSWGALAGGRNYKVLKASVTFYKGKPGDEVIIILPIAGDARWGAVDNIIIK